MRKTDKKYCMQCRSIVKIERVGTKGICPGCERVLYDFSYTIEGKRGKK